MMSDPPVSIEHQQGDDQIYLWNTQESTPSRQSDPRVDSVYSTPSDETFLIGLEEQEQISVQGSASALRIAGHSRYSDEPMVALSQYAARLLALVNGKQGDGWLFRNEVTGRDVQGVIEEVSIFDRRGAKYEFDYSVTFRAGQGMMPYKPIQPEPVDPSDTAYIAGQNLHEIEEQWINKKQKLKVYPFAMSEFEENGITAQTGATREITLKGSIPGDESVRTEFDDTIRARTGQNITVDYESAFPGTTLEMMVSSFDTTRQAGWTRLGEYHLELVEGTVGSVSGDPGAEDPQ